MNNRTKNLVTAGLMVGILTAALDQTIVDTAFPKMISELGGVAIFTWVITAYMLAATAVGPVVGKLADIFGRKTFFLLGLVLFVGGSVLCGIAHSMPQLIGFRFIQGLGAGMLMPISFTIVGDLYPGQQRAKMQGLFSGMWGLASVMGPKLGGWLTHNFSWRWVFYVNVPIGLIAFLLILIGMQESRGARRPVDYWGSVTITGGVSLLMLALLEGGQDYAWGSWQILTAFAAALALLIAFLLIEQRVPEPVLDLSLFTNRTYTVTNLVGFLSGMGMFGCVIFVPWFIQGVVGVNPDVAGNVMTPMMITIVVFSILTGRLSLKVPYRWLISTGLALNTIGFLFMTRWNPETTLLQATLATMVFGAGLGLILPITTLVVQNAFPANYRGQVTSATSFFRSMGNALGVSVFGVIFNKGMSDGYPALMAKLQPIIAKAPPLGEILRGFAEKPQGLMQVLLRDEIRAKIPAVIQEPLVLAIKDMTVGSLHTVYWLGAAIVVAGLVVTQLLGNVSLQGQIREAEARGEHAETHAAFAE